MPTPPPSPPTPPRSRLRSCLIGCGAVVLVTVLLVAGGLWFGWRLWRSPPPQWTAARQAVATMTPEARRERAVAFEERIARELSFTDESLAAVEAGAAPPGAAGPSEAKTIAVDPVDVNAWLGERFDAWAAHQGVSLPAGLQGLTVWIEDGRPVVAGQLRQQVVSATIDLQFQPDGRATVRPMQLRSGQVHLPADSLIEEGLERLQASGRSEWAPALRGEPFDPVIPIDSGRQARIVGYDTDGGTLNLRVRAEPRP